jgi:hypothetical protein
LGRRAVSPGMRQVMAVVALPKADDAAAATLQIRSRTYWRRYFRRRQTTGVRLAFWPFTPNGSRKIESERYDLTAPPTEAIQTSLEPGITKLQWTTIGDDSALVLVEGKNLFSGTEVLIGDDAYRDGDGRLLLKSDRAFQLRTKVAALSKGEAVLNGRYGRSAPLLVPIPAAVTAGGVNIYSASCGFSPGDKYGRISLTICAAAHDRGISVADLNMLPDPIVSVNDVCVPFPYDYRDKETVDAKGDRRNTVVVEAWVPAAMASGRVQFKVPFCGPDWSAVALIWFDPPTIERLGGDADETLIIWVPFDGAWVATVDEKFELGSPEFQKLTENHLALKRPAEVLSKFSKLELRLNDTRGYVLDIPPPGLPKETKPTLDAAQAPAMLSKGKSSVIDLQGAELSEIIEAKIGSVALSFKAYADGARLRLFVPSAQTGTEGQYAIDLRTRDGAQLSASFYVLEQPPNSASKPLTVAEATNESAVKSGAS